MPSKNYPMLKYSNEQNSTPWKSRNEIRRFRFINKNERGTGGFDQREKTGWLKIITQTKNNK